VTRAEGGALAYAFALRGSGLAWEDWAQAHRTGERGDIPGEVVLVIDDDLAATLEI
jgi:hypothetical protein